MRKILILICILGISSASLAKTDQTSWANLNTLQAGQKIQIVEMNSKQHSRRFLSASDSAISYKDSTGEQTIQKQDVRSVKLMENKHRLRNTLIGAAAGAGLGAGIGAGVWEDHGFLAGKGTGAAVCAGIGFVVGTIVGVLIPGHETVYKISSH